MDTAAVQRQLGHKPKDSVITWIGCRLRVREVLDATLRLTAAVQTRCITTATESFSVWVPLNTPRVGVLSW